MINILLIVFSIVYIVDFSGIIVDLSKFLWELTHPKQVWKYNMLKKPFNCSTCLSFWFILIYSLSVLNYTFVESLSIACVSALSTNIFKIIINTYIKLTNK